MVPTQRKSQLCLLLLGLLGMTIWVHAPPPGITPAQWFVIQHINMTSNLCDLAMRAINRYNLPPRICKNENTFLKTTLPVVANLCRTHNIPCFRQGHNCHRSSDAVNVTYCNATGQAPTYLQCHYQQYSMVKNYSIACDTTNVPVHFDRFY
ncbi:non-secretory ribonuclease-like [Artibeus jamaicensis]|uniref:non-secretory ribonuclease-like n=1 Tax=Artibeus jamaicensis TaxID=9417 RepID=UPI00235B07C2|nr:non-secretory ribonuclease-like [Artibeus jamaicensis]